MQHVGIHNSVISIRLTTGLIITCTALKALSETQFQHQFRPLETQQELFDLTDRQVELLPTEQMELLLLVPMLLVLAFRVHEDQLPEVVEAFRIIDQAGTDQAFLAEQGQVAILDRHSIIEDHQVDHLLIQEDFRVHDLILLSVEDHPALEVALLLAEVLVLEVHQERDHPAQEALEQEEGNSRLFKNKKTG